MAKKRVKSGLAGKLGTEYRKAFDAHKSDETDFGSGGDLPPGIEGGIAQLVDCKFDTYSSGDLKGEYYFYAAGIVKKPAKHEGLRIEGLRTSIMEPLCDTPNRTRKTIEDHLAWILNELRKLGVETEELGPDDLEGVVAALKEEGPHFQFRTWQGEPNEQFPNPRTNHQWKGAVEYDGEEDDDVEESEEDESEEESEEETTEEETEEEAEDDLEALGKAADEEDEEAAARLTELATELGIPEDDIENTDSWEGVAGMIESAQEGGEEESEEEGEDDSEEEAEEEWEPAKGDVYFYKPPKKRKATEFQVTAVFGSKQTCNLKSLDDGKIYKSVSWDKLEEG